MKAVPIDRPHELEAEFGVV
jgi:hypothetical protein